MRPPSGNHRRTRDDRGRAGVPARRISGRRSACAHLRRGRYRAGGARPGLRVLGWFGRPSDAAGGEVQPGGHRRHRERRRDRFAPFHRRRIAVDAQRHPARHGRADGTIAGGAPAQPHHRLGADPGDRPGHQRRHRGPLPPGGSGRPRHPGGPDARHVLHAHVPFLADNFRQHAGRGDGAAGVHGDPDRRGARCDVRHHGRDRHGALESHPRLRAAGGTCCTGFPVDRSSSDDLADTTWFDHLVPTGQLRHRVDAQGILRRGERFVEGPGPALAARVADGTFPLDDPSRELPRHSAGYGSHRRMRRTGHPRRWARVLPPEDRRQLRPAPAASLGHRRCERPPRTARSGAIFLASRASCASWRGAAASGRRAVSPRGSRRPSSRRMGARCSTTTGR